MRLVFFGSGEFTDTMLAALLDDAVEVFEVEAGEGCRLASDTLSKVGLPKGVLVAAVWREDRILVPTGSDRVNAGVHVVLITTSKNAARLDDFLGD